jgi:hypothetical protein
MLVKVAVVVLPAAPLAVVEASELDRHVLFSVVELNGV